MRGQAFCPQIAAGPRLWTRGSIHERAGARKVPVRITKVAVVENVAARTRMDQHRNWRGPPRACRLAPFR